eukprot:ANDGO_00895.mRNA.1 hypothetical protein
MLVNPVSPSGPSFVTIGNNGGGDSNGSNATKASSPSSPAGPLRSSHLHVTKIQGGYEKPYGMHKDRRHVVLLGDSVFDNPLAIHRHLSHNLFESQPVTLLARGGSVASEVHAQLRRVPDDVTHFVVSVGGNDAMRMIFPHYYGLLDTSSTQSGLSLMWSIMTTFPERMKKFEEDYNLAIESICEWKKPVLIALPYNPNTDFLAENLGIRGSAAYTFASYATGALGKFGMPILHRAMRRVAEKHGCATLDLRTIIHESTDYVDPIHPSHQGMQKIAHAIACELAKLPMKPAHPENCEGSEMSDH